MKTLKLLILIVLICKITTGQKVSETKTLQKDDDFGEPLYLTPYINSNKSEEGCKLAKVNLKTKLSISSYSGLFTVDSTYNSNIFHWYFVAERNPNTAPVLLWLNGGPGVSSMLGLFQENGPFSINNQLEVEIREHRWTKNHHVIYIDNPVGTGFSYTNDENGYANNTEDCAKNVYKALVQFFQLFPNLKNNDLYLTGESYAGKYIPALSHQIIQHGKIKNLKGVAIGNGFTHPIVQVVGFGDYLYQQDFIDDDGLEQFNILEQKCKEAIESHIDTLKVCGKILDPFNTNTLFANLTGYANVLNILKSNPTTTEDQNREDFVNQTIIRKALHVGNLTRYNDNQSIKWRLGFSIYESEKEHVEELLANNYRVLIYSGQLDVLFPPHIIGNYVKTLNYSQMDTFKKAPRHIWKLDNEVAGFIKTAGPLTEVMVIGGGHMVPTDQPKRAFDLITKFTRDILPK